MHLPRPEQIRRELEEIGVLYLLVILFVLVGMIAVGLMDHLHFERIRPPDQAYIAGSDIEPR